MIKSKINKKAKIIILAFIGVIELAYFGMFVVPTVMDVIERENTEFRNI